MSDGLAEFSINPGSCNSELGMMTHFNFDITSLKTLGDITTRGNACIAQRVGSLMTQNQDKMVNTLCNVQLLLNADTGEAELNCEIGVVQVLRKKSEFQIIMERNC